MKSYKIVEVTDTTGKPVATVLELTLTIVFVLGCLTVISAKEDRSQSIGRTLGI